MNSRILKKTPLYDLLCDPEFQLSETGFCRLLVNLIDSLQELRQNRIYFSDLHLKNIYRSPDGTYKIDYSENCINKYIDSFYGENSPWFMPPEVYKYLKFFHKFYEFAETTAVYEVGLIAHYLLNDFVPPFWEEYGRPALNVRMDGLREIPTPKKLQNPSGPFESILARIINVALQHEANKRQSSLEDLRQEIHVACNFCEEKYLFIEGGYPDKIRDEQDFDRDDYSGESFSMQVRFERLRQEDCYSEKLSYRSFDLELAEQRIRDLECKFDNEEKRYDMLYRGIVEEHSVKQQLNSSLEQIRQEKKKLEEEVESLKNEMAESRKNIADWCPFIPHHEKSSILSRLFGNRNKSQSVYSSVFAPAEIAPKQHLMVQVYLHLPEETEKVKSLATEADKNAERRGYEPLEVPLKKGDNVEIELNVNGDSLLYNCRKSVIWQGSFVKRSFDFAVPADINVYELSNSVNIYVNGAIAGELIFLTSIVDSPRQLNTNVYARQTKKLFISYSHKDIALAEKIAKIHEALGIDVFFDKHRLKAGYIYSEEISRFIQNADTFVLCWSENAAKSAYVEKERQEALALAYPQSKPRELARLRIHPYNIEPHAVPPADMIEQYHFEEL